MSVNAASVPVGVAQEPRSRSKSQEAASVADCQFGHGARSADALSFAKTAGCWIPDWICRFGRKCRS